MAVMTGDIVGITAHIVVIMVGIMVIITAGIIMVTGEGAFGMEAHDVDFGAMVFTFLAREDLMFS